MPLAKLQQGEEFHQAQPKQDRVLLVETASYGTVDGNTATTIVGHPSRNTPWCAK